MRRIELVLAVLAVISIVYKLLFGAELNLILIMSLTGLSLFYTYFSFLYFNDISLRKVFRKEQYQNVSKWKIIGTIGFGIGLGISLLGILWSLMSWPFNNYYSIGIPMVVLTGLIAFIRYTIKKTDSYIKLLKRSLIIGITGTAFWINPNQAFSKYEETEVIKEQSPQERIEEKP